MADEVGLRAEVLWFAQAMERELQANDHKSHWSGCEVTYLLRRLRDEMGELDRALSNGAPSERIISEAADVANFAMMVADNARVPRG